MKAIPFFAQERIESCVPACVRMILAACGIKKSEQDIYTCCRTDVDGTLPSAAAACFAAHDLKSLAVRLNGLDDLRVHIQRKDSFAILFVQLAPLTGISVIHAVVLDTLDESKQEIHVLDPAFPPDGKRVWTMDQFALGWRAARYQTIFVSLPGTV